MKKQLATLALLFASASSFANPLSFDYIQGETSELKFERIEVLSSHDAVYDYFGDRGSRPAEEEPIFSPDYDFELYPLIAVHHGTRSSSGYQLKPVKIVEKEDNVVVHVREIMPGENCSSLAVATAPYTLIMMKEPRPFNKPIEVKFSRKVGQSCN